MNIKFAVLTAAAALELCACAAKTKDVQEQVAQEQLAKSAPRDVKILVAGFGTIESVTQVDKWLGEQLQPRQNLNEQPTLSSAGALADPNLARDIVRLNWNTRKMEYIRESNELAQENARNAAMLRSLRTKVLTDESQRYVPIAKDYLQSFVSRKARNMIKIVDRSNVDMGMAEQAINGNDASKVAGAGCILTATVGDREQDEKTVPIDGKGTLVKSTIYTQPFTFKVRDLSGNVLMADHGTVSCTITQNNIVRSSNADPARKLTEAMCEKIADSLIGFFTTELQIKVKVPKGMDADDVEIAVDGRTLDDSEVRVLAVEHLVKASLEGCNTVRKLVEIESGEDTKSVRITLKKPTIATAEEE